MNNQLNFYMLLMIASLSSSSVFPESAVDSIDSFKVEDLIDANPFATLEANLREAIKPVIETTPTSLECKYAIEDIIKEKVIVPTPITFEFLDIKLKVIDEGRAVCDQKPLVITQPITILTDDYFEQAPTDTYSDYAKEYFEWLSEQINLNYDDQPVFTCDQALAGAGYICLGIGIYYLLKAAQLDWNNYWETKARLKKLKEELQARKPGDRPRCVCHEYPCAHSQPEQQTKSIPSEILEPITPEQAILINN